MSLVIKDGTAFIRGKFQKNDILIEDGIIKEINSDLKGDEMVDASGMLVFPGLIDPHVHLREPGDTYKEDFATGSRAALAGGFTTVMDMPNNSIPTTTRERLIEKEKLAKEKAVCDILFHFGGTDDNLEEVRRADPGSLKLYLGMTTGKLILKEEKSLENHLKAFPSERQIVLHACDHSDDEEKNLEKTYATIENAVSLAKRLGRKIHLAHASTKKEVTLAKRYPRCTVEVAPHHLLLSTSDRASLREMYKVYPPLRSEQKRLMLWSALDLVDCVASDHAPHTIEDKEQGAAGFPGLETSLALMLDACTKGLLDRIWVAQRMSQNAADIFSIRKKGRLLPGYAGDVTIADPKKVWTVSALEFQTKCKWSPFEGKTLKGKVRTVIKDGQVVLDDYHIMI